MSDHEQTVFGGRYELHRRLARGGMADVFLARDQLLDRPVAIKVLFPEFATDPSFVERFRREAQSAANLNHPNIVGVFDWGEEDGTYFIVMEYVDGRSLAEILGTEGALLPERAADIGIDVAAALGFAHRNGVIHRDVKPGNILISPTGQVKVTDFGIARAMAASAEENLTQVGAVMGTATYFSPEQAQGKQVDPRSDVYSLGVVLYEAVCGRPPFTGDSPVAIAYKHVQEAPVPPSQLKPDLHPAMEAIILKAIAKNTLNRYPSAEDLRSDLRRYREGHRILAEPIMAPLSPTADATQAVAATSAVPAYEGTQVATAIADDDYEEEPRRNGVFIAVLLVLLLVLAGLLFALARTLGFGDNDDPSVEQVAVPTVIDLPQEDAEKALRDVGLVPEVVFEKNDDKEDGIVFDQSPAAGERIDEGSTVTLKVSEGGSLVKMPQVTGQQERDARQTLLDQGFTATPTIERRFDDEAPKDEVIEQNPTAETDVPLDTPITLIVSDGPEAIPIPDVAGKSLNDAIGILQDAGFRTAVAEEFNSTVPADTVIGTNPPATEKLAKDETVTIRVSKGTEEVSVPNVVGSSRQQAINTLQSAGFVVSEQEEGLDPGDTRHNTVISQDPGGNARAPKGSTVTIVVGKAAPGTTSTTTDIGD